ncbi:MULTISPECIES: DUF2141 domain-containing protein [unclassified Sphingopyxis]|uniref:DUF2141 domain-containing protein n=1 Tax=unclassified Sphingopyxis TaxID=2614943 RepID=UPI00073723A8|nr:MULTISPECIES: DUF2141 domain-containing protein [unclassified Sphingopyxis]KTE34327.1 hypothetical protein ATE62_16195 [Sphingopyxis sp. HIX]KTE80429.1 hypothetical protein ATE72_18010 [Sphingopyxis sp. HXXIV]
MSKFVSTSLCIILLAASVPTQAEGQVLSNDLSKCRSGPSTLVQISGLKAGSGKVRVQAYRATSAEWLAKGRWINRIEVPARAGSMTVCVPLPEAGSYGIAVRHDVNGNGKTDLSSDGGGMSNNPSINIFNLGKPSYKKTAFAVGNAPKTISITMKYM